MFRYFKKHVSVLVIPDDGSRTLEFKLNYIFLWGLGTLMGGLVIMVFLSGVFFYQARYWKYAAQTLGQTNARLRQDAQRIDELAQTVTRMKAWDQQLRNMLSPNVELPPASYAIPVSARSVGQGQVTTLSERLSSSFNGDFDMRWVPAIWPVSPAYGWVTREFEAQGGVFQNRHLGIDIAAPQGTPVHATADGRVVFSGFDDVLGYVVAIDHGGFYLTRYGHNSALLVVEGEEVRRGQQISLVGNSGHSTGPHLHYEIIEDGRYRNPRDFIPH